MEEKNIRQILKRYLLGNAGEKDINAVDNWYTSFDSGEPSSIPEAEAAATREEIWNGIVPTLHDKKKVWALAWQWKAAAIIIIIAGAAGIFLQIKYNKAGRNAPIAFATITTGTGERRQITLRDSSRLMLNAGTTIRIRDDFSHDRQIELVDGEVFFDVQKDAHRPFIIQSGELTTTVLGTAFNISAYKELNTISIGVIRGKVSVAGQLAALSILEKDEELVYNKNSKVYKKIPLDESQTVWQDGRLQLNDLSFAEMSAIVRKNFGIDIVTDDNAINNTRYTIELLAAMSPTEAAEVLAAIHNLKLKIKDSKIVFYK